MKLANHTTICQDQLINQNMNVSCSNRSDPLSINHHSDSLPLQVKHTLNSSIYPNNVQPPMFVKFLFQNKMSIHDRHQENENQFGYMKEENKNQTLQQLPQTIQNIIKKFTQNLIHRAYIYREHSLNTFQKEILAEKYTEFENIPKQSNEKYFQLQQLVWEALMLVIEIQMIFWLPLHIGFQIPNNQTFTGMILFVLTVDFLKVIEKHFNKRSPQLKQTLNVIWIDVLYLSTFCLHTFINIPIFNIIAFIILILVNLSKIQAKFNIWQDYISFDIKPYTLIFKLLFIIHVSSCLLHFIGEQETSSWITETDLEEQSIFTKYCTCLYWSTATLLNVGQSHIQLKSAPELIFSSILMLLSGWIFSNILVNVMNTQHVHRKQDDHIQQVYYYLRKNIGLINQFFQNQNVSTQTMAKVRKFIRNQNKEKIVMNDIDNIIQTLSSNLKNEVMFQVRVKSLLNCKCLKMFSTHVVQKLTDVMESNHYNKDEIISQTDYSLHIIDSGKVQILECNKVITNLTSGDTFGEYCFFSGNVAKTTFKIIESSKIWIIKQDIFINLIKKYQLDYEKFMYIKQVLQNGDYSILDLYCYSCNSKEHLIENCPQITYKPNREKILISERIGEQCRQSFHRDTTVNHRLNNKVLRRLNANNESLYRFQLQERIITEDELSNNQLIDSSMNEPSEKMLANISNNRVLEQKQQTENNQSREITRGLQLAYFKRDSSAISPYRISLILDRKRKQGSSQDQPSQYEVLTEEPIPPIKQVTNLNELLHKKITQRTLKTNLKSNSLIYKTSKDSISLSNRLSLDEMSSPFQAMNKNFSNTQLNSPSKKVFSSKLSMIPERTANTAQILSCWIPSPQSMRFNIQPNFVDLSTCKPYGTGDTEFDNLHLYTIYYPEYNVLNVVQRLNYYLRKRIKYLY